MSHNFLVGAAERDWFLFRSAHASEANKKEPGISYFEDIAGLRMSDLKAVVLQLSSPFWPTRFAYAFASKEGGSRRIRRSL